MILKQCHEKQCGTNKTNVRNKLKQNEAKLLIKKGKLIQSKKTTKKSKANGLDLETSYDDAIILLMQQ